MELLKCRILPPENVYEPILPCRVNGKLVFPLCRTCAEAQRQGSCCHGDDERALEGMLVLLELHPALSLEYTILEIIEARHFEEALCCDVR